MFDNLLKNKGLKALFFNQFKGIIKDNNLRSIIISIDEKGEYKVDTFKEPMAIISQEKLNILIQAIKDTTNGTNENTGRDENN